MTDRSDRDDSADRYYAAQKDAANAKTEAQKKAATDALKRAETDLDFKFGPESFRNKR